MRKKLGLSLLCSASFLYAEISEIGTIVGLEASYYTGNVEYLNNANNGGTFTASSYTSNIPQKTYSAIIGYQYYYTRVYVKATLPYELIDTEKKYSITNSVYEVDVDYLPLFYTSDSKSWDIRGILGLAIGVNSSTLKSYDDALDKQPLSAENNVLKKDDHKMSMEYGFQVGLITQTAWDLNFELGYRIRSGNLLEFSLEDESGNPTDIVTFFNKSGEIYLGINYLF